jgi:precorrin isomerase
MAVQQIPGLTRTDLQEHDLSAPGREVIQNRVEISPDAPVVRHGIRAKRSSMSSKARSSIRSTAKHRRPSRPVRSLSCGPKPFTQ